MPFVIALGFVLAVFLASGHGFFRYVLALSFGVGLGIWLTALLDARLRRQAAPAGKRADGDEAQAIFAALEDIHWRLKRLEEAGGLGPSPLEAARDAAQAEHLDRARSNVMKRRQPGEILTADEAETLRTTRRATP
jgi:hypothetical protein